MLYLVIKAAHIIAIVVWFAGLFYLPRLFMYHSSAKSKEVREQLALMEKRLYKIIMNNAVMIVFLLGFALLWVNPSVASSLWFQIKFLLVLSLLAYHIMCGRYMRQLAQGDTYPSAKFFRFFNEIPTILLIIVVCLAIIKPF